MNPNTATEIKRLNGILLEVVPLKFEMGTIFKYRKESLYSELTNPRFKPSTI